MITIQNKALQKMWIFVNSGIYIDNFQDIEKMTDIKEIITPYAQAYERNIVDLVDPLRGLINEKQMQENSAKPNFEEIKRLRKEIEEIEAKLVPFTDAEVSFELSQDQIDFLLDRIEASLKEKPINGFDNIASMRWIYDALTNA